MLTNHESERAFLGCWLLDCNVGRYEAAQHAIDTPDAYTDAACKVVAATILEQTHRGEFVSLVSVMAALDKDIHGNITAMVDTVGSTAHAAHYAKQVADAFTARKAAEICAELSEAATSTGDVAAAIRTATQRLSGLGLHDGIKVHRLGDFEARKLAQWEAAEKGEAIGVPFCLPEINHILGGMRFGIVSVLAAYRGTGKSTLARQQAAFAASRNIPTLLLTLEDTAEQADACIAGMFAEVSVFHLDIGQSGEPYRERMRQAWAGRKDLPLFIVDRNCGIDAMSAIVERHVREYGIKLVVLDHIQYIAPSQLPNMSRVDTLAHYSTVLCGWAKQHDLHVMALSQLSNAAEQQGRKRVRMSDIRGCGAIADDCRQAMALYESEQGHVLEVLKNNAGISNRAVAITRMDGLQRFE